jgi:SAM-dependent methyltransferase
MLNPLDFKQPLKLDIGAGDYSSDDSFTSIDAYTDADIKAFMWDIPLPDACVDVIFSSNALEHVSKFDVVPTLREWHRILKPGGKLQIIVPDLEWAVQFWLALQGTSWDMDIIYGHQKHEGEYHKTGFTPKIIWNYLVEANKGGWNVHKIEYLGGDIQSKQKISDNPEQQELIESHASQRLINVEASKV